MIKTQSKQPKSSILKMKDDIMFKAFFSRRGNEHFLKDLLSAILGEKIQIKKVIHDARLEQLAREQKYGVLDLDIQLEDGQLINVEMQIKNYNNIEKRTTFYASKKITEQLVPKTRYEEMKKVIIIAILDYSFLDVPEYVTRTVRVADKHREYEINNNVEYHYIELEKFRKQNPNMKEPINQWLAFLDMERGDLLEMAKSENKKIKEAVETYEVLTGDEEMKRLAEIRLMSELEEQSALETARDRGEKEGIKQGKEKGIKQGMKEGLKQGKEEGIKQTKKEITKKLIKTKMPIEEIEKITGLTEAEIKEIKKEFNL